MSKHWVVFLAAWLTACTGETTPPEPVCGNGLVEGDEECDDDNDDQTDLCLTTCQLASCGDGLVFATIEQCDEGAANSDTGTCKTDCTDQRCGDGDVGPDEECDDENFDDTDACRNDCTLAECGDGHKTPTEECDDGNDDPGDGCSAGCLVEVGWLCDGSGCECAPGHEGTDCGVCSAGYQDDDQDGVCEPGCDLFDVIEGCPLGTECDVVSGTPTCVAGCPVFVDFGASGDGSGWGSPMGNLQAAIDTAAGRAATRSDGCDVWVAEGTLEATLATDTITLRPDVDCYGGFAGDETSPDQRPRDEGGYLSVETILDGGEIARHVVTGASDVTFDGFIIQGGNANGDRNGPDGRGGGLYAEDADALVLRDMWFRNNSARTGGALAAIGGWFSIHHSRFDENTAQWDGGAIAAIDTVSTEVFDTAFVSNVNDDGWGGAIYSRGGGLLWLESAYFFQSSAQWDGGAIWHAGNGAVVLAETTITDTNPDTTQGCLGGALFVRGFDASDVTKGWATEAESLQSLSIVGGEYDFNRVPYEGGAFYLKDIVQVGIWGAEFDGNEAIIRVDDQVQFSGGLGGAIVGYDLQDVTFGGASFLNNESGWNGGAVALFRTGSLVIDGGSFETNESHTGQGGGLFARDIADVRWNGATFSYNVASVDGGGAYLDEVGTLEVRDGTFYENLVEVSGMGAGLYARGDFEQSVASVVDTMFEQNNSGGSGSGLAAGYFASLDVRGTSFLENGNGPYTGAGSALYARFIRDFNLEHSFVDGNGYNRNYGPGGLYVVNVLSAYIGDTVIQNHPSPSSGSGSAWGGLMVCNDVSPFITGGSCNEPTSSGDPALELSFDTTANIEDSMFSNNEAGYGGSHVWAHGINELTIARSTLTGGDSVGGAAVWHQAGGDLTVTDCAFEGNVGESSGSAINVQETTFGNPNVRDVGIQARLVVHSSTFDNHGPAPAIRVEEAASVAITDSDFTNPGAIAADCSNSSIPDYDAQGENMGGAVHVSYSGPTTIEGCSFEGFQAQSAGALSIDYVAEGPVTVKDTTFKDNHARWAGGTLVVTGNSQRDCAVDVVIDNVDVENSSSCNAGGVFNAERLDTLTVTDSSFVGYASANDSGAAHIVNVDEVTIEDTSFVGADVRNDVAGALLIENGYTSSVIEKVSLDGVSIESSATSSTGGGVQIRSADVVEITGSRFEANSCDREFNPSSGWCLGAGVFIDNANEVVVSRTAFFQNNAVSNGVNEGQIGGGLAANAVHSLTVRASVFWDNLVLHNDLSSTGVGGNRGAAIAFRPAPWSGRVDPTKLYVQGSTFVDNDATFATAITIDSDHSTVGDIDIVNSIIRGPGTVVGTHPSQGIPTADIRDGNVQGLPNAGNNVIDVNPDFQPPNVDDVYDQFRLSSLSTGMIYTGTGSTLSADPVDFDGVTRHSPPSMGAFEYAP